MPSYIVTAPDGKEYDVDAPEGATEEQALDYFKSQWRGMQEPQELPSRTVADIAKDVGVTAGRSGISALQGIEGLADIMPGVNATKYLSEHGVDLGKAKEYLQENASPQQQQAYKNLTGAKGAGNILSAAIDNPSAVAELVGENILPMLTGGAEAKLLTKGIPAAAKYAPSIGEGLTQMGQEAQKLSAEAPDKELSGKGIAAAVGSGAIDAVIGRFAGKLVSKGGGTNVEDTLYGTIARDMGEEAARNPSVVKGLLVSTLGEGAEEALQSAQEKIWDNYAKGATNLPTLLEGAVDDATLGSILGSVMGAGSHSIEAVKGSREEPQVEPQVEPQPESAETPPVQEPSPTYTDQSRQVDIDDGVEAAGVDPEDHPELYKDLTDPKHYQSEATIDALEKRLQGESEKLPSLDDKAWEAHLDKQREYIRQTENVPPAAAAEQVQAENIEPETIEEPSAPEQIQSETIAEPPASEQIQTENVAPEIQEQVQPEPKPSVSTSPLTTEHTVESLQPHLTPEMKRLVESGKLTLHDTADTLPGEGHPENVQGLTTPQGEVHLVASKLTPETLPKVAMHEMGVHVGMRGMVGDKVWGDLTSQALTTKGTAFDRARQSVPENTPEHLKGEETLAYLVENAPKLPIVKRMVSAVKNWARTTFGTKLNLTEADAHHLAAKALRRESQTANRAPREETAFSTPQPSTVTNPKLQEQIDKDRQTIRKPEGAQKKTLKERVLKTTSARNVQNSMDIMETNLLSHDARFVNELRRALESSGRPSAEIGGIMDKASQAQTINDTSMSAQASLLGGMQYDGNTAFWVAVPSKDNVVSMRQLIDDTQAQYGWPEEEANKFFTVYMSSRRLKEMYGKVHSLKAEANKESNDATKKALFKQASEIKEALDKGGISEEECNNAIEAYQSVDKFVEAEAMWHRIRPSVINTLVESGLYSKQKAENYLDAAFYTPMYRVMHESSTEEETENIFDEMANGQYRSNISSLTKGMRELKFKGSKREVFNMMDNIEHWVQISYSRAIRAKKATDLIESARRYMPEGTVTRIHGTKSNKDGAITCYFHGKKQYWKFDDPLMAIAFHGVRAAPLTLKPLQKLTSNLRDSIVLTPTFTIAQLPQDIYSAAFSSGIKNPVKLFTTMLSEFKTTAFSKEDTAAHKILRDIGAVGTKDTIADSRVLHLYDTTHHTHLSKDKSAWRKFKSSLEKFAMAGDNAIRQAVYVRTMEELKGDPRAKSIAYQRAFDVINFRRRGASAAVEQIRCVTPFMGAALQAQRAALQVVAGRGLAYQSAADKKTAHQRLFTTSMVMMTTSFIYNMLYGGLLGSDEDKDKFNKRDIRYKDTHIMMFGADSILSIPVRPDIFALPYITGNHLFSAGIAETENPRQTAQAYREAVAASFGLPLIPPPIKEGIEQVTNYDMFTGRPIVPERLQKEDPGYQYDSRTSQLGKLVGMAAPNIVSPTRFDHFMKGWFGGVGTAVLGLSNIAGTMASDNPSKDHTLREIARMFPSVPNLVPPEHMEQTKATYYDLREAVEGAHATYNAMKKDGRLEDARRYKEKHKNLLNESVHQKMNHLKTETDKIHLNTRKILNNKNISSEDKASRITALEARERKLLSHVQDIYNKVYP